MFPEAEFGRNRRLANSARTWREQGWAASSAMTNSDDSSGGSTSDSSEVEEVEVREPVRGHRRASSHSRHGRHLRMSAAAVLGTSSMPLQRYREVAEVSDDPSSDVDERRFSGASAEALESFNKRMAQEGRLEPHDACTIDREWGRLQSEAQQEQRASAFPCTVSSRSENKCRNRYPNVVPFDHNRVIVEHMRSLGQPDYINASYVNTWNGQQYVCCQAPTAFTVTPFWWMVWEQRSPAIVMLTPLVENGRIKADLYWPESEACPLRLGELHVHLVSEEHLGGGLVQRTLEMHLVGCKRGRKQVASRDLEEEGMDECKHKVGVGGVEVGDEDEGAESGTCSPPRVTKRRVVQLHFGEWSDFSAPEGTAGFLDVAHRMEQVVEALRDVADGPPVVHCSAGIGRTGTFVAIHTILRQLRAGVSARAISVFDLVMSLRRCRCGMVQSAEQYRFIYDVFYKHAAGNSGPAYAAPASGRGCFRSLRDSDVSTVTASSEDETEQLPFHRLMLSAGDIGPLLSLSSTSTNRTFGSVSDESRLLRTTRSSSDLDPSSSPDPSSSEDPYRKRSRE